MEETGVSADTGAAEGAAEDSLLLDCPQDKGLSEDRLLGDRRWNSDDGCCCEAPVLAEELANMLQDIGLTEAKFVGLNLLKNGSDCCCGAAAASPLPHDMGLRDDREGAEKDGKEDVLSLTASAAGAAASPLPHDMGLRDDREGAERDGSEGMKEDPESRPDDAAAGAEGSEYLGTARSISC